MLNLGYNQLTTLPKEIEQLKNLQTLDLNNNQLTTIPKEIGQL
ncbi:leucine rich repeat protein [Leptospira interrogans str. UI 12758]|uniref:Leucine rich repeat protein n=1 Tax=Leptospira interrogans str. UI 12758 TaxID=1049938 RepID=A0A0E2DCI0_LEPIR|nr:leucine rich repeat protein [Leptospira interrogans str. UI 12758]